MHNFDKGDFQTDILWPSSKAEPSKKKETILL